MIQTRAEISVDVNGRWFYRDAEITNHEILKYFKQNLYRKARYFISNVFGELREEGYLDQVLEAPVFAISASYTDRGFDCLLDSEERITVPLAEIKVSGMNCLFFVHPRGIAVRLKTSAMAHVAEYLTGSDDPQWTTGDLLTKGNIADYLQP